jgi:hypothetical protein
LCDLIGIKYDWIEDVIGILIKPCSIKKGMLRIWVKGDQENGNNFIEKYKTEDSKYSLKCMPLNNTTKKSGDKFINKYEAENIDHSLKCLPSHNTTKKK